jgi:hypothetical protein
MSTFPEINHKKVNEHDTNASQQADVIPEWQN